MNYDNAYVYGGLYSSPADARSDFDNLGRLYQEEILGPFQAAMVEKTVDGKVRVLDTTSTTRSTGAAIGAAIGAVLGFIFPPAIPLTAAGGAGLGAATGDLSKGWTRGDVKKLGSTLAPGQVAVFVIAEAGPTLEAATVLAAAVRTEAEIFAAEDRIALRKALEEPVYTG